VARSGFQGAVGGREIVAVSERGHIDLPQSMWEKLVASEGFRRLLDCGVLKATLLPERGVRLHGSCYVGRAQCGEVVLELREKIAGALRSLLGHATHDVFRVVRAETAASELGDLAALLVHQFLSAVTAYASRGRNFRYTVERRTGSLVGGRLDITKSIRLRARGLGHLLVFDRNTVSHNTPVNRIVLAALREVERLTRIIQIPPGDVVRARGLAMLFADFRDAEMLFGRRTSFVNQAQILLGTALPGHVRDMIALAGVVLAHESFEHSAATAAAVPRTWLLNLEALFETAVRNVLADTLRSSYRVTRSGGHARRVFARVAGEYTAHPDLVVSRAQEVEAVGDVKYKTWDMSAAAGDVYQLLVHAAAFECRHAFLVFPSDRFEVRRLGDAATGCDVMFFAVDIRNLRRDVGLLVAELGISAEGQNVSIAGSVEAPAR